MKTPPNWGHDQHIQFLQMPLPKEFTKKKKPKGIEPANSSAVFRLAMCS